MHILKMCNKNTQNLDFCWRPTLIFRKQSLLFLQRFLPPCNLCHSNNFGIKKVQFKCIFFRMKGAFIWIFRLSRKKVAIVQISRAMIYENGG